jgi:hypothetical protein
MMNSLRIIMLIISLIVAVPGITFAQNSTAITPVVSISPGLFQFGQRSSFFITITNGNLLSSTNIVSGDSFIFTFGPASGSGITLEGPIMVNSSSFGVPDFGVVLSAPNQVTITYQGGVRQFRAGESFTLKLSLVAPSVIGSGRVTAQGPPSKIGDRYNQMTPGITNISFADFPTGPKGDKGDKGDTGPQGPIGMTGPQGVQGPIGMTGPQGSTGATGQQGIQGIQGEKGLNWKGLWSASTGYMTDNAVSYNGSSWIAKQANTNVAPVEGATWTLVAQKGDTGPQGLQGIQGIQGQQGPVGNTGSQGPQGNQGLQGVQGIQGVQGVQGLKGLNWKGTWSNDDNYAVDDAVSYNGSSWIAKQANLNITPVEGVSWTLVAQKGDTGAIGVQGQQGPQGTQGIAGVQGPIGATGETGPQGQQGPQGVQGVQGQQGLQGAKGLNWKGAWSDTQSYSADDAVSHNSSSYVAVGASTNVTPGTDPTKWNLLAQKGDTGPQGSVGSLSGDVTGTPGATVIATVGGISASNVASGVTAVNNSTSTNAPDTIVKRDASGNFSAGTITAGLSGNATTATTASGVSASAGDSVVTAINASSSTINAANVSGDVELAPTATQTTSSTNHLINLKLVSTDPINHKLGTPGVNALLSLSASGTYPDNSVHDKERFRIDNDGSILSVADYTGGINTTAPIEGAGTRFMWYATKAAIRAGEINGTQWDDANIGLYSTAFGQNVRALGDNAIVVGKNSVAANTGTVALGEGHTATGANSVALGYGASTSTINGSPRTGTFVFSDRSVPLTYSFNGTSPDIESQFHPTVTNSFNVRAVNGSFFYTNTALTSGFIFNSTTATMTLTNSKLTMASDGSTTLTSNSGGSAGVTLPAGGGSWNNLSDRNMKANFAAVDTRAILRGVLGLPISTWNYKSQDASVRHIGPMAQDFFATFKVGEGDKTIATIDPDGVALAAIQGLHEELKDRDGKIGQLEEKLRQQQVVLDALRQLVCQQTPQADICRRQ